MTLHDMYLPTPGETLNRMRSLEFDASEDEYYAEMARVLSDPNSVSRFAGMQALQAARLVEYYEANPLTTAV